MTQRRVFISGMGAVAPNGVGVIEYWRNSREGISGLSAIDVFDTSDHRVKIAGSVRGLDKFQHRPTISESLYDRVAILAKIAADEALEFSGLDLETVRPERTGIIFGQGLSGMQSVENWHKDYFVDKTGITVDDFIASFPNAAAAILAMEYKVKGLNYTINAACSSSSAAIGLGAVLIRSGVLDVCIAGGADAPLTASTLKCFEKLKILNAKNNDQPKKASRPFSGDRKGFVLSEGAGILVLEAEEHLEERNGNKICEIIGYGSSNDASHILAPNKSGQVLAIRTALKDAGIAPNQVDYIHAHGTGTRLNDFIETEAIKEVYGKRSYDIPISSVKSMIGHTIGASGALSIICTVQGINDSFLPPTINLNLPDPQLNLDYIPLNGRQRTVEISVVNAFGFGGNNNIIILKKNTLKSSSE